MENADNINTQSNVEPNPTPNGQVIDSSRNKGLVVNKKIFISLSVIVIALIVFFLLFIIYSNDQKSQRNAGLLREANENYLQGNLDKSEKALEELINNGFATPDVLASLIQTIANEGSETGKESLAFQKAKPYADQALKLDPNNLNVLDAVGYLYEIDGQYSKALSFYNKVLSKDPSNAEALFHVGHTEEFLGNQQEAFTLYENAYKVDPENPYIALSQAKVLLSKNDVNGALQIYKKVVSSPNASTTQKAETLTNEASLTTGELVHMGDAISLAKKAVQADPNYSPALQSYGFALGLNGSYNDGISYMKKAIVANPRISQNYWQLGMILRADNQFSEAAKYMSKGLSLVDNDNTIFGIQKKNSVKASMEYDLAKTLALANENQDVLSLLNEAIAINPSFSKQLQFDVKYGEFKNFTNNPGFTKLIQ